ncbi:MAG: zinc-dependent metalloprotease family protein [Myxococcota bacterium]
MRRKLKADRSGSSGPLTVYLNGKGGRVYGGHEDAPSNRSSIVWSEGSSSVVIPAYSGSSTSWRSMVRCVQGHFGDYEVNITDQRPARGSYIMMMVGGRGSVLGYSDSVAGVAPYTGGVVDDAVGFVFSQTMGNHADGVCETTAHEIGHTLGLDHTYHCSDLMSYEHCGEKSFVDRNMPCGEWDTRTCSNGRSRQNSHGVLAKNLGLRTSRPEPTSPGPEPRPRPEPPVVPTDTRAPRITMHSAGGSEFEAESIFVVQFDVTDESGLQSLELLWRANGKTEVYRCSELPAHLPIECGMVGNSYAFALLVGEGLRKYAVRVTDEAGNRATTRWRQANFVQSEPTWEDEWDDGWDDGWDDDECY